VFEGVTKKEFEMVKIKYDDGLKAIKSDCWVQFWELSSYNNGQAIGRFFDLEGKTKDEFYEEMQEWLDELTEITGELCEEWILGDAEGVPSKYVGEYGISDEFFEISEVAAETGLDMKVINAGLACDIDLESIAYAFVGEYDSDEDFAFEMAEASGFEESNVWPNNCIDWERAARDLMYDYSSSDGFYFSNNY
jgi:antirestriction protein